MHKLTLGASRQNGMRMPLVAAVALVALAACLAPAASYAAEDTSDGAPLQNRIPYDQSSIESRIHAEVNRIQGLYSEQGQAAFAAITSAGLAGTDAIAPFVVDADTLEIVAHGASPQYVGQVAQTLREADKPISLIRSDLEQNDRTWITHTDVNPANGQLQTKRTLLHLYDGYIFSAGHYLPDSETQQLVEETVRLYELDGIAAFGIITPDAPVVTDDLYPFVIDAASWTRVADGVVPDRVGQAETILDTSGRSVEDVLADLRENGATWTTYTFHNPATDISQLKRTWLYLHDGYVFGSGYYPSDSRAQALADSARLLYAAHGRDAFEIITPDVPDPLSVESTFVLDAATLEVVAHAIMPDLVGTISPHLSAADIPLESIMEGLRTGKGVWVWHMALNPATQTDQLVRTHVTLYDGYIFGASYSLPDIRAQSVVDESIYTYRNDPQTGFDVITSGELNRVDLYPAVRNATHILAHGTVPGLVGPVPDVQIVRSGGWDFDTVGEGDSLWSQYAFFDSYTGITQIKRAWLNIHDGYVFLSPYTIADADTQSVTDFARFIYESNREGDAWIDIITPDAPVVTDDLYPFVIDAASWTRVADGVVPDRVGQPETILDTSGRSVEDVLADLEDNGRTWLTYTFHNPATGVEQLKRTYLQLRDGLVFGSGYYTLDSQVKAVTYSSILEYNSNGRDATIASINTIPEEPVSTYVFVADPHTGITEAQNVDPGLTGTADWDAIAAVLPAQDVLDVISREPGMWVSYGHTEPVTGQEEAKRAWLVLHDGLVFGSGYYSSNIPESDVRFAVSNAIRTYESYREGDAWIDVITPDEPVRTDALYPFVIDAASWTRVADGVVPDRVGQPETILDTSSRSVDDVLAELEEKGSVWVTYTFHNPATGVEQLKRSYLQLRDGLVFGSGYYILDSQVQSASHGRILEYERDGRDATIASIDTIPEEPVSTYVFVADPHTGITEAQNVDPGLTGTADWDAVMAVLPAQDVLDVISRGTGMWVSYEHTNPATGQEEAKRTWLVMHDGLVFGSGYYSSDIPESDVRFAVSNAIRTYESYREGDAWIDVITPDEPVRTNALYPFVIDAASWTRVADGVVPDRVGQPETILDTSSRSVDDVLAELEEKGSVWVTYTFHNPATGVEQLKRSYLQLRDGLVFGSGYYILDSQVQSASHGRILEYERDGRDATLASIDTIPEEPVSTYVFVADPHTGITEAQNVDPGLTGTADWDAVMAVLPAQDVLDVISRGTGMWVSYEHTNPATGQEEAKRTWLVMHDDLVFGSGYYSSDIPESDVRFAVSNAIRTYESYREGDAWIDVITPDEPVRTNALYPFVIDAASWTRMADGVVPDRVGQPETILDTSSRSVDDVLAELEEKGSVWVTYTFHNPATGVEQLKRSYLQLRDGLVFGSGYYILDSQVQSASHGRILEYERDGRDATLASIDTIPEEPVSTYVFVADPRTGITEAQNVDPGLTGTADWDAIAAVLPAQDVLDVISRGTGMWVSYEHTNPATGQEEAKRTWLVMHDDLVFGSGYYSSDIPESDVRFAVSNAIRTYESYREGDAWIDVITPDEPVRTNALYPFVIDAASWTRMADGVVPDRVGQPETILDTSSRSVDDVLAELEEKGSVWVTYTFHNPATGVEQLKRSYLQLRDGLVFGSGYYILDSQVQSASHGRILEYERDGRDATLASIDTIPEEPVSTYVFVADPRTGITEAQNVDPGLTGTADWDAIAAVLPAQDVLDVISRGTGMWVSYDHTEPVTGQEEAKRTWLVMHDDLVFGSGYYSSDIPESDVRFAVSNAIRTYESYREGDAWIDVITPDEPVRTDALYPFVIDAASWTRVADGVVPDRVGQPETILDTSSRSVDDVLAELEEKGSVWVTYTFHNPATGVEQLKRSYLQLRDGLVFGSGYYILDSQVQSASHGRILEYERDGRDATLASIDTIPEEPVSTYVFVADPRTGITEAQNVDPGLTGTADWDAIAAALPAQDVLDVISRGTGMWVSYGHTNPATGQEEAKRTWLVMHDGLVFGSGYYSSDISGPAPYGSPAQQIRDGVPVHEINCNSPLSLYIRDAALPESMLAAAGAVQAGTEASGMSEGTSADGSMLGTGTPICVSASTANILAERGLNLTPLSAAYRQ